MKPHTCLMAAVALVVTSIAGLAFAQTDAAPPLSAYGDLPSLELVQISPSGQRLAFVTVVNEERRLALVDMKTNRAIGAVSVGQAKVRDLEWVGEDRVMITTSTTESLPELGIIRRELFHGHIYDSGARRIVRMLGGTQDLFPVLLSTPRVVRTDAGPEILVRAHSFLNATRLDLYRIDPTSGRVRFAENMNRDVDGYVLDARGRSVARSEYDQDSKVWSLHLRQGENFRETWRTTAPLDSPGLMGLGMGGESIIVAADRPDLAQPGREDAAFFDVNLQTGVWRAVRFEFNPQQLFFHPVSRRLIGAARTEDKGQRYAFADPEAGLLWAGVESGFPDAAPVLTGWSDDFRRAVVFTSGSGDSGTYHLLDMDEASFSTIGRAYRGVPDDQVAAISAFTYAAADGLEIHAYLTVPNGKPARNLPLVVLVHGGPASRDVMGFDWWAQALASRGYAVLQANFRGSTGYGDAFLTAGYGEWGRKMQSDLSDGVRDLATRGIVDPGRVCIVGASYGGYAALAGPTLDPGVYRCAASIAGVSDLRRMISREAERGQQRDNEAVRYWNRFMGGDGPGDRSLDARSPARLADSADAPILLIHGKDDTVVPVEQSRVMAAALRRAGKPHELIELAGEDHWLSRAETRIRMLTETVRFLEVHNPAD